MPSKEILQRCWENNPDGAGYAFNTDNIVCIKKGFMTFDAFWNSISKAQKQYDFKNRGVLIHFRIATHGGVIPAMTHPFPIVDDNGALSKLEYVSDYAVIHNGIISLTGAKAHSEKAMSDTAVFIRDYLTKIAQNRQWFKRRANMELIEKLIDSKMAILNNRGEIINTSGFTEDGGVLYSNSTYKDYRQRKTPKTYLYDYDYDYDYGYGYGRSYGYNSLYPGYKDYREKGYGYVSGQTVPMMKICRGESIEGDMISEECHDDKDAKYAVSKEGFLYEIIPDLENASCSSIGYGPSFSLEYIGIGRIFVNGKEKEFSPNYYPNENQFLQHYTPEEILDSEEVDYGDAPFEELSNEEYADLNK